MRIYAISLIFLTIFTAHLPASRISHTKRENRQPLLISHGNMFFRLTRPDRTGLQLERIFLLPESALQPACMQDARATIRYQRLQKRTPLTNICTIETGNRSWALIRAKNGTRYRIGGDSRVRFSPGQPPRLIKGSMLSFPRDKKVETGLFMLRCYPRHPRPGTTVHFLLKARRPLRSISLRLRGKRHSRFYRRRRLQGWDRYLARFGLDCADRRREQPFILRVKTKQGIVFEQRKTIRLSRSRGLRSDFLSAHTRTWIPGQKTQKQTATRVYKGLQGPGTFPLLTTLLEKDDLVPPRKKKRRTHWRWRWSKRQARARARRRRAIQRESRIHTRALSHSHPRALWRGEFLVPAPHRTSSPFGAHRHLPGGYSGIHRGVDIASPANTHIKAPANGIVRFAGRTITCGNNVIIDHGEFVFTKIFHMRAIHVKSGERVKKGQVLGTVGSTGFSMGPHIHWEMWVGNTRINPWEWASDIRLRERALLRDKPVPRSRIRRLLRARRQHRIRRWRAARRRRWLARRKRLQARRRWLARRRRLRALRRRRRARQRQRQRKRRKRSSKTRGR